MGLGGGMLTPDGEDHDDGGEQHGGGGVPVKAEAAFGQRFVEEVADDGAQWAGQDERRPEKQGVGQAGPSVRGAGKATTASGKKTMVTNAAASRVQSATARNSTNREDAVRVSWTEQGRPALHSNVGGCR